MRYCSLFRLFILLSCLGFRAIPSAGQTLVGTWIGTLTEEGGGSTFALVLHLEEEGNQLKGQMQSVGQDTTMKAVFQVSIWRVGTDSIFIQDTQQLDPASPAWCVKRMALRINNDATTLEGTWRAAGCVGGRIKFNRFQPLPSEDKIEPFLPVGEWTGLLSQSDRSYGFYFTLQLNADGTGTSYIVSEGSGGEARHSLVWKYDSSNVRLSFQELEVVERTIPSWKWCIKQAILSLDRNMQKDQLAGPWSGQIEKENGPKSQCASGEMRLEKPLMSKVLEREKKTIEQLPVLRNRPIRIAKTLEVEGEKIRLYLWDNGMIDGDVVSVYLNGKRLLDRYRVQKGKAELTITLEKGPNFLVLVSEDMGTVPPSTIAVSIHDGREEHQVILRSNQYESGAVLMRRIDF